MNVSQRCPTWLHSPLGRGRQHFTLIELLVVIAIIAILAAMLLPVLSRTKETARRVVCLSEITQINKAALLHAADGDEALPPVRGSINTHVTNRSGFGGFYDSRPYFEDYIDAPIVFYCPSTESPHVPNRGNYETWQDGSSYGWGVQSTPGDYYTFTNVSILAGFKRHKSTTGAPMNYLFDRDEEITNVWNADKGESAPKLPDKVSGDFASADDIPYAADFAMSTYASSLVTASTYPLAYNHRYPANNGSDPWINVYGHLQGGDGGGVNTVFLDGHGEWRRRSELRPSNFPVGGGTYPNNPVYLSNYDNIQWY